MDQSSVTLERMRTLADTSPIPYRQQNGGDYLIPSMQLRPELEASGDAGFSLHLDRWKVVGR